MYIQGLIPQHSTEFAEAVLIGKIDGFRAVLDKYLTLFKTMDFSIKFGIIKSWWSITYIEDSCYIF